MGINAKDFSASAGDVPLVHLLFLLFVRQAAMLRQRRIVVPGLPHHITQRGNRHMNVNVFVDGENRPVFLRMLQGNKVDEWDVPLFFKRGC